MDEEKLNEELKENTSIEPTIDQEDDFSDDDFDSESGLLTGLRYDTPEDADKFVDSKDGTVIDKANLTPLQIIKTIAKQNGNKIKDPSKGCKHCHGQGFEGKEKDTQMPIPCRCLFRGKTEMEKETEWMHDSARLNGQMNHAQKRRVTKALYKQFKLERKRLKNQKQKPETEVLEEDKKNDRINEVLKTYISLNSLMKTSKKMNLTLTETKKIVKENKEKIEELKTKE